MQVSLDLAHANRILATLMDMLSTDEGLATLEGDEAAAVQATEALAAEIAKTEHPELFEP